MYTYTYTQTNTHVCVLYMHNYMRACMHVCAHTQTYTEAEAMLVVANSTVTPTWDTCGPYEHPESV